MSYCSGDSVGSTDYNFDSRFGLGHVIKSTKHSVTDINSRSKSNGKHQGWSVWLNEWMNGVLGLDSALQGYTEKEATLANEMNFVMNHAPGSIVRHICQQSSALPL